MTSKKTIDTLASQLKAKQPLDPALPLQDRRAAVAALLAGAGKSVSPAHDRPRQVLTALANIERMAALASGDVTRLWLAIRALGLMDGEKVAGPELDHPCAAVFLASLGASAVLDPNDRPQAWLGHASDDELTSLPAKSRSSVSAPAQFKVTRQAEVLFAEPQSGASDVLILDAIDQIPSRDPARASQVLANGVLPLHYDVLPEPELASADGDALFADYKLSRIRIGAAKNHPTPLVEPAALSSVPLPHPSYAPVLDQALIASGALSDVQIESIIYAGQAHSTRLPVDLKSGIAFRRGFLIGHGTGVGKGRIAAGIIRDNWNQGRRRAVWVTENQKLLKALRRDWQDLGGREADIIQLIDAAPSARLPHRDGILFASYALLRSDERLSQIVDWFGQTGEGVVVLDECQAGRNAVGINGAWSKSSVSQQGEAMLRLQDELPNARITYSSATSAMDIIGLGYAKRLGLWGPGTAFPDVQAFFKQMEIGGIGALELVARDMKALGLYLAGNLSMVGVDCRRMEISLTAAERQIQDELALAWQKVNMSLQKAMASTGIMPMANYALLKKSDPNLRAKRLYEANFRTAKNRFFQALLASLKTRRLIPEMATDIANGLAPVVQLTNTYEANLNRSIEASKTTDHSDVDATPRDILLAYIEQQFPIFKHHVVRQNGVVQVKPILGKNGEPEIDQAALADKQALIAHVMSLDIPDCPLDQILSHFGPDMVAEVTGRSRRLVPAKSGAAGARTLQERTHADVEEDIRAFQDGRKKILLFSTAAGGTGDSYHADRNARNQKKRRHYVLQAGWRADQAIQGMGRTNRSNQVVPPEYVLVCCDLWSDRRMISNVASGMEKLGAITKGQRHAAAQDLFTNDDNLESELATDAWVKFITDLRQGNVVGMTMDWFQHETGILLNQYNGLPLTDSDLPTVRRFLNAMSGMTCDRQEVFGEAYKKRLDELKMKSLQNGSFDRGVEWIQAESIIKVSDEIVWKDPVTGAVSRLLQLVKREKIDPIKFQDAKKLAAKYGPTTRIAVNAQTNRVAVLGFPDVGFQVDSLDQILMVTPKGEQKVSRYRLEREYWRLVTPDEAKRLWDIELTQLDHAAETWFYMVTGLLLPIWDRLPKTLAQVWRLETDEGERILGRLVPDEWAGQLVTRLSGGSFDAQVAMEGLQKGATAMLANGWLVYSWPKANGGVGIELAPVNRNDNPLDWIPDMEAIGVQVKESWDGKPRFILPQDEVKRDNVWHAIASKWPVMSVTSVAA